MTAQPLFLERNELKDVLPNVCRYYDPAQKRWRANATILVGPPGTGKTTMVFEIMAHKDMVAWYNELTGLELERVPLYVTACHPDATAPEVIAQYLPLDGKWTYIPQSMLRAWGYNWHLEHVPQKTGDPLLDANAGLDTQCNAPAPGGHLLDDLHLMGPGGQAAMYKALDSGYGGNILDPWGRTFFPHQACTKWGTMNGEIDSLDPAVVDRTAVKVPVMTPSEEMLGMLSPDMAAICEMDYDNNMDPVATYREWLSISQLRPVVGLGKAVLMALGRADRTRALVEALAKIEGTANPGSHEARDLLKQIVQATPAGVK